MAMQKTQSKAKQLPLKVYLVGGAVRDKLLGLRVKERDWVVVGSTPEAMLARGFVKVGRDFPVFLHPKTHEEYALARTERKTGKGYTAFQCYADPSVTLEEDLLRRDLTINAIARTKTGKLIDPYHGQRDLRKKILRHVSAAFAEDPVRILRVARFASRFCDFKVHPATTKLMRQMLLAGEVAALVPERVWQELVRALGEICPSRFFAVLNSCGALPVLFPELASLATKKAAMAALKKIVSQTKDPWLRFAALGHGLQDVAAGKALCSRLRVPRAYQELLLLVIKHKSIYKKAGQFSAAQILAFIEATDALRRKERFSALLAVCAINASSPMVTNRNKKIWEAYRIISRISVAKLLAKRQIDVGNIREELHRIRLEKIKNPLTAKKSASGL